MILRNRKEAPLFFDLAVFKQQRNRSEFKKIIGRIRGN
jgi:hypothetical protein